MTGTYRDICKAECEWCAKGMQRVQFSGSTSSYHLTGVGSQNPSPLCTAPTKDEVIERQAKHIAKLEEAWESEKVLHKGNCERLVARDSTIERHSAEIAELRKSWQPIETAPKTGIKVLVGWPGVVNMGRYDQHNKLWFCPGNGKHFLPEQPTHWMPLPWRSEGVYIDPDTDEVDWFDKRAELAQIAFIAGRKSARESQ